MLVLISLAILERINDLKNSGNANFYKLETKIDKLEKNTTDSIKELKTDVDKLETRMTDSIKELKTAVLLLQMPWLLLLASWFYFH